jgi:hypothetical protein
MPLFRNDLGEKQCSHLLKRVKARNVPDRTFGVSGDRFGIGKQRQAQLRNWRATADGIAYVYSRPMSLADERRSRRFRDRGIDPLAFRVFLALVGALLLFAAIMGIRREPAALEWWGWLTLGVLLALGAFLVLVSFFGSQRTVDKWSTSAGAWEAALLLVLVAYPLAWAIRKLFRVA